MEWLEKHANTIMIIIAMLWINAKYHDIDRRFHQVDCEIIVVKSTLAQKLAEVEKEIALVKTIMIMKNLIPVELAQSNKTQSEE